MTFKSKIFNDPIYGFITVNDKIIMDLIDHPFYQRLRRIKQLGMTHLVYPGALHTRFHHAMGAMHLMGEAIETLKSKEIEITKEEETAAKIAILLHDIGHGPFSHALETSIVNAVSHEDISKLFMNELNKEFNGQLTLAIEIFNNRYKKHFLHQLVSSQLDVDRLDYLNRDSFFTGVSEGVISWDRIIKTLNVFDDKLVVDSKGIYSIEKFLISRRLMYWQVYLHKTVLAGEHTLIKILKRAKYLADKGEDLFATPAFSVFLKNSYGLKDFEQNPELLKEFALLDDYDIYTSIKVWTQSADRILAILCSNLINRKLNKIELQNKPFEKSYIEKVSDAAQKQLAPIVGGLSDFDLSFLVYSDSIKNSAYNPEDEQIQILNKNKTLVDIAEASDQLNIKVLSNTVEKFFFCYPKHIVF